MDRNRLFSLLASVYGIIPDSIFPVKGGFSTKAAYRVTGRGGTEYFLKVYDKLLPTTSFFVDRIDMYMPALRWLSINTALVGRILTPIPALNGTYKAEADGEVFTLFLYVNGTVPGVNGMTCAQTAELAEILALLHSAGEAIPFETTGLTEDISLPFCGRLLHFLDNYGEFEILAMLLSPHAELLHAAIHEVLHLRDTIRVGYSPIVLCHGDAHGNNVIQAESLTLADWEDLRWAPAEADLFIHAWHPHGGILLEAYTAARSGYCINHELLYFYTMRRHIEDVWFDIQRLTEENPDEAEASKLLDFTRIGIDKIEKLYLNKCW